MSKSNPIIGSANPASKFLTWKSKSQSFTYWDNNLKEEIGLDHSNMTFVVLDQLNTVTGVTQKNGEHVTLYSNEVRSLKKNPLHVKCGKEEYCSGYWEEIRDRKGIKFCKSIYAMAITGGNRELVCFKLSGAGLGNWFEVSQIKNIHNCLFAVTGVEKGKKGSVEFTSPIFEVIDNELNLEDDSASMEMDRELQAYLKVKLQKDQEPKELAENRPY